MIVVLMDIKIQATINCNKYHNVDDDPTVCLFEMLFPHMNNNNQIIFK